MFDLANAMAADASAAPSEEGLTRIAALALRQQQEEGEVKRLEGLLAEAQRKLRITQCEELPSVMQQCGVKDFTLENGSKITIKKVYSASITDDKRDDCLGWLKNHGHDDLIKNDFTVTFGKGEDSRAAEFESKIQQLGVPFKHKQHVHPQTLGAFVREQLESGQDFPIETFSVFIVNKAVIK